MDPVDHTLNPRVALYTGAFDPCHLGHVDVVTRASRMYERVVVAVSAHRGHKAPMFDAATRVRMIAAAVREAGLSNVTVVPFDTMAVDAARAHGAGVVLRGLRQAVDFEYEANMVRFMAEQDADVDVVFVLARGPLAHLSSTALKQLAAVDVTRVLGYVPAAVGAALREKLAGA